ncbi:Putative Type III effector NopY [Bradyrhizobium sp. ORS 285]|uniref:SctD/MshK family protein n=1 Tax=Bradyrhizobium sp. ORS 285 TaxID=115808 RepID=UPI0005574EDC|nr:hypothetical protein [Bradyrhizobium sp. ORS 285]SMX56349.1 Putative Type III effector NopY [Bradyrhizobium sp. ORS 285]
MDESISLEFEVLSGLYAGLRGKATGLNSIVGSGLDADIIFVEQELAPHHFRIIQKSDSIEIEALSAPVSVEGRRSIIAGERLSVPLPSVVQAGAMSMRWSTEGNQTAASSTRSRASIVAFCLLLLSSTIGGLVQFNLPLNDQPTASNAEASHIETAAKSTADHFDATVIADEIAASLRKQVDLAGLTGLHIRHDTGVVTAEGTIPPNLVAKWKELQKWFDLQTNGTPVLVNAVIVKEEKTPSSIAVQAVWRGRDPYLLIAGQKYFVGALLSNGWTIDKIDESRVLLKRNGRSATLPY